MVASNNAALVFERFLRNTDRILDVIHRLVASVHDGQDRGPDVVGHGGIEIEFKGR
jgi:hypothetical protein